MSEYEAQILQRKTSQTCLKQDSPSAYMQVLVLKLIPRHALMTVLTGGECSYTMVQFMADRHAQGVSRRQL